MKQIQIGDSQVHLSLTQYTDGDDTVELKLTKFSEALLANFKAEDLKIALRYMTEGGKQ